MKTTPKQKEMLLRAVTDARGRVRLDDRHEAKTANSLEDKKLGKTEWLNFYRYFVVNADGREAAKEVKASS